MTNLIIFFTFFILGSTILLIYANFKINQKKMAYEQQKILTLAKEILDKNNTNFTNYIMGKMNKEKKQKLIVYIDNKINNLSDKNTNNSIIKELEDLKEIIIENF